MVGEGGGIRNGVGENKGKKIGSPLGAETIDAS